MELNNIEDNIDNNVKKYIDEDKKEKESEIVFETTDEHFKIFCEECKYWIKKLNLLNYEIFLTHELLNGDRGNISYTVEGKIATVALSTVWYNVEPTNIRLSKLAFHELMELLLGTICTLCEKKDVDESTLIGEIHSVIRILENTFFRSDYNNRQSELVNKEK